MDDLKRDILYASTLMMQKAEIVHDVYDILLYALCFSIPARGGLYP